MEEECKICYEQYSNVRTIAQLSCGHSTCSLCIRLIPNKLCPFCRQEYQSLEIESVNKYVCSCDGISQIEYYCNVQCLKFMCAKCSDVHNLDHKTRQISEHEILVMIHSRINQYQVQYQLIDQLGRINTSNDLNRFVSSKQQRLLLQSKIQIQKLKEKIRNQKRLSMIKSLLIGLLFIYVMVNVLI